MVQVECFIASHTCSLNHELRQLWSQHSTITYYWLSSSTICICFPQDNFPLWISHSGQAAKSNFFAVLWSKFPGESLRPERSNYWTQIAASWLAVVAPACPFPCEALQLYSLRVSRPQLPPPWSSSIRWTLLYRLHSVCPWLEHWLCLHYLEVQEDLQLLTVATLKLPRWERLRDKTHEQRAASGCHRENTLPRSQHNLKPQEPQLKKGPLPVNWFLAPTKLKFTVKTLPLLNMTQKRCGLHTNRSKELSFFGTRD